MILLLSGGVDSICAWRLLGLPQAVNFDLGTVPTGREKFALELASLHFQRPYLTRQLPMGSVERENGFVDFRNALLILAAAQIDNDVVLAAVAEWAPDKNTRFYRRLERAVNRGGVSAGFSDKLRISAPFAHLSKGQLLAEYYGRFGGDETRWLLENTWSCYQRGRIHCGWCGGCRQRYAAERELACNTAVRPVTMFSETPGRWRTPPLDKLRWVADNRMLGLRQMKAHDRQDDAMELWVNRSK